MVALGVEEVDGPAIIFFDGWLVVVAVAEGTGPTWLVMVAARMQMQTISSLVPVRCSLLDSFHLSYFLVVIGTGFLVLKSLSASFLAFPDSCFLDYRSRE